LPLSAVADIFMRDAKPSGGELLGPMSEVEHNSLRYLHREDMYAIADYLKSVTSASPPVQGLQEPLGKDAGRKLYESNCAACHNNGVLGAPQVSKPIDRDILRDQGVEHLYQIAIKGEGPMPAKGGCSICSEPRVEAAVDYMLTLGGADKADTP